MKIFFDTNVILDILDTHRPSTENSSIVLSESRARRFEIVITTQSIIDSYYVAHRTGLVREDVDRTIAWFSDHVIVRSISVFDIQSAIRSGQPDFEDAAQVLCADAEGCDVFLSNDRRLLERNFGTSMLMLTPQQFVDKMRRQ